MSEPSQRKSHPIAREAVKTAGLIALLLLLMMWLSGAFLDKVEPGPPAPKQKPPEVVTQKVEKRRFPQLIDQVGTLSSRTRAKVSSRVMAQVKEVMVKEGDKVTGNDRPKEAPTIMARLDDQEIKTRLRQAEAQVNAMEQALEAAQAKLGAAKALVEAARAEAQKTEADYSRYQDLYRNDAATEQQLDHMKAQMEIAKAKESAALRDVLAAEKEIHRIRAEKENAEAAEAGARIALKYTIIQAPFSGQVIKKMVEPGDMATPGAPLFTLDVYSQPELHSVVSDSLLASLRVGQKLNVYIDALDKTYEGRLREITPLSDPSTRTVLVKVALPQEKELVSGFYGRLAVPHGEYETLVIPLNAVIEVGQLHLVNVVNDEGYPQRRFITIGQRHDDVVEVLSGLSEGEEVVIHE